MDLQPSTEQNKKDELSRGNNKRMEITFESGKKKSKLDFDDETMARIFSKFQKKIDEREQSSKQIKFEWEKVSQCNHLGKDILASKRNFSKTLDKKSERIKIKLEKNKKNSNFIEDFLKGVSLAVEAIKKRISLGDVTLAEMKDTLEAFNGLEQNRVDFNKQRAFFLGEIVNHYLNSSVESNTGHVIQLIKLDPNMKPNDIARNCLEKMNYCKNLVNPIKVAYDDVHLIAERIKSDLDVEMNELKSLEKSWDVTMKELQRFDFGILQEKEKIENKKKMDNQQEEASKEELERSRSEIFEDSIKIAEICTEQNEMELALRELPGLMEEDSKLDEEESFHREQLAEVTEFLNNQEKELEEIEKSCKQKEDEIENIVLKFKEREDQNQVSIKAIDELVFDQLSVLGEKTAKYEELNKNFQEKEKQLNEMNQKIETIKNAIDRRKKEKKDKRKLLRSLFGELNQLKVQN